MKKIVIITMVLTSLLYVSCVKDLNVKPLDKNTIMSGNLNDDPAYLQMVLGKIYGSFIIAGQGANGGADIASSDENFFTTMRALWNLQEITTDEAICGWGDVGIADLNTQTWTSTNPFLTALYQRLGLSITYANDFISKTAGNTDPNVVRATAEARFLRALAYYYFMDMFGNPPFTTEKDGVGKFFPKQIKRGDLFNYVTTELRAIENQLGEPKFSYPQADKAAAWMLLARVYLNAKVYTGTAKWDSCQIYCNKVISSGKYSLATKYRQNFSADNDGRHNPEMIFAWEQDGVNTQGYVGTTFLIESSSDSRYIRAEDFHGLTSNTNWNGNRGRRQFMNVLVDTLATYGNVPVPANDTLFKMSKDSRVLIKMKKSMDIPSASSSGDYGIGVYKFTARNTNGSQAADYNPAYASTDYPIFRYADAILMRAEALFNQGDKAGAANDINQIRQRAFGDSSHNVSSDQVTAQLILNERGKEFYYEGLRRTDLVRFGQFSSGTYTWQWKGGVYNGKSTNSTLDIFPIPGDEVAANPNIKQNPGYN